MQHENNRNAIASQGNTNIEAPPSAIGETSAPRTPSRDAVAVDTPQPSPTRPDVNLPEKTEELSSKEKLALYKQNACLEIQAPITKHRVSLFRLLSDLEDFDGQEDYTDALLEIVTIAGPKGILISRLHNIFPEAERIATARKNLVANGKVTAVKSGNSWLLKIPQHPDAP